MAVLQFECAIARPQISRFLSGSDLDAESLEQLTTHVRGCADCRARVAAARREAALGGAAVVTALDLPRTMPAESAASASFESAAAPAPPKGPRAWFALYRRVPESSADASNSRTSPKIRAALCGAGLIAVLGVMSYLADPTKMLGARAAANPPKPALTKSATRPAPMPKASSRAAMGVPLPAAAVVAERRPSAEDALAPVASPAKKSAPVKSTAVTTKPEVAMRAIVRSRSTVKKSPIAIKPLAKAPARSEFEGADAIADDAKLPPAPAKPIAHRNRIAVPRPRSKRTRLIAATGTSKPKLARRRSFIAKPHAVAKPTKKTPPAAKLAPPTEDTIRIYDATRP